MMHLSQTKLFGRVMFTILSKCKASCLLMS